jgi:DNA-binding NarL/FixJ family response regulator
MRILLVDDHPLIRLGIRSILDGNYEICGEASNGAEAVVKAAALVPDLVLMDVNMPLMDGLEATRRIRQMLPTTIIVVLTLHDSRDLVERAKNAGADAVLTKGTRPDEIIAVIDRLASERRNGRNADLRGPDATSV